MTIKRHEAMILSKRRRSDARQKFSPCNFSLANSCRQIHIFCAKFIISSHLATLAIGSANPVARNVAQYPLHHVTYSATNFEVATSKGLGGDAFTRNFNI